MTDRMTDNPFSGLSADNRDQIHRYMKFFRQKREGVVRSLNHEFSDATSDHLHDDTVMYSKEDVEEIVDHIRQHIRGYVYGDIGTLINMGALTVSQLLENAQSKGTEIFLDTNTVENQMLLDEIEKMSLEAAPKPTKKPGELMSFKDEARMRRDETDKLDQVNKKLQDENARLKQHIDMMGREMRFKDDSKAVALQRADQYAASQVRSLEDQLAEAKEEGTKRVSETTQFQQMRKMMQTQSSQIRDLRRRLQKYEPDDCKMDDA